MPDIVGSHNCSQVFVPVVLVPVDRFEDSLNPEWIGQASNLQVLNALIDTGAQGTSITEKAAQKLQLEPDGMVGVRGVHGPSYQPTYIFKLGFVDLQTNPLGFQQPMIHMLDKEITGPEFDCGSGEEFDVLLGMDILGSGTLTVSAEGKFRFTF